MSEVLADRISIQDNEEYIAGDYALPTPVDFDFSLLSLVSTPPNQFACSFLKNLPTDIVQQALSKNRYKDKALILKFCIECYLEGRSPSSMLISKRWGISNANFWIKYSFILLKLSILNIYKGVDHEEKNGRYHYHSR